MTTYLSLFLQCPLQELHFACAHKGDFQQFEEDTEVMSVPQLFFFFFSFIKKNVKRVINRKFPFIFQPQCYTQPFSFGDARGVAV